MLSLCLALALSQANAEPDQVPADAPADAPVAPSLTPSDEAPPAVPTRPPEDPKRWTRVWLSGAAGVVGTGAAFGAMLAFSGLRSTVSQGGASFDLVFGTAALGALLCAGFELAIHQLFQGRGEVGLAALAAVGVMALTSIVVGSAQLDPLTGAALVAGIGAIPAAVSVTAILEATSDASGRRRIW